jgi:hypothetical protein
MAPDGGGFDSNGLYYKHMTIVNDDSSIISEQSFQLIDDPRGIIYDCHMFIIQATGAIFTTLLFIRDLRMGPKS